MLELEQVSAETFGKLPSVDWLSAFTIWGVLSNNVRALLLAALLAVFSFGTLAVALLMAPLAIVFFFVAQAARLGYSPVLFFAAFVLPHGVLELPAAAIATALAVRLGATFMSPRQGVAVSEGWLWALADFVKVFVALVLPLLAFAAAVEVHVTPFAVVWAFGG
jgi:stage II sporulation protein M